MLPYITKEMEAFMNNIFYSILLVLIGTFFGTIIFIVINYIRGIKVNKKIDEIGEL